VPNRLHGHAQTIAFTWTRHDDLVALVLARRSTDVRRRVAKCGTDLPNADVQAVLEIDMHPIAPDRVLELFTGRQLAAFRGQQRQRAKRLAPDADRLAALTEDAGAEIHLETGKAPPGTLLHQSTSRTGMIVWTAIVSTALKAHLRALYGGIYPF
jgi:hypothetical protein